MSSNQHVSPRPLSPSAMADFSQCSLKWALKRRDGHLPRTAAPAWFGKLSHEAIRLAYGGLLLPEAMEQVWLAQVGPIMPLLKRLLELDHEYVAAGDSRTKAAKTWRSEHPEYDRLLGQVAEAQRTGLGHLRWGEKHSLFGYYRRAMALASQAAAIILPNAILVEGLPVQPVDEDFDDEDEFLAGVPDDVPVEEALDVDDEGKGTYATLAGDLAGVRVVGVPDVVAMAGTTMLVADYKTGRIASAAEVAQSGQLHLYVELLRQHGHLDGVTAVRMAHVYLTEDSVVPIWIDLDQEAHARVLQRLALQAAHTQALIEADLVVPAKGLFVGFMSPCSTCDMAHVCPA
jgi:hypothetical protein